MAALRLNTPERRHLVDLGPCAGVVHPWRLMARQAIDALYSPKEPRFGSARAGDVHESRNTGLEATYR